MLSTSLSAIISQSLLPKIGSGRMAILELLLNNSAISNLIRENKIHQIYSQMQLNQMKTGMRTQTQSMVEAIRNKFIDKNVALRFSTQPQELSNLIGINY